MYVLPKKLGEKRGSHSVEAFSSLSVSKKMESCHLLGQTVELQKGALKKLQLVGCAVGHLPSTRHSILQQGAGSDPICCLWSSKLPWNLPMLLKSDLPLVRACSNRDNQPASGQGNHQSGDSASAEGQLFSAVRFSLQSYSWAGNWQQREFCQKSIICENWNVSCVNVIHRLLVQQLQSSECNLLLACQLIWWVMRTSDFRALV